MKDRFANRVRQIDDEVLAIVGFVELALLRAAGDEALIADLEEIRTAAIRAISNTKHLGTTARALLAVVP